MIKRKKFGQHFLKSDHIAKFIVDSLNLKHSDIVYEIGTGRGILLPLPVSYTHLTLPTKA